MNRSTRDLIDHIESNGYKVMNWRPGRRRIFMVLDGSGGDASLGMYIDELKAWFKGYSEGLKKGGD